MELSNRIVKFLRPRLSAAGIRDALVVDDAFSGPTLTGLEDDVAVFWNGIERSTNLWDGLESYGIVADSECDITDQAIDILWSRRNERTILAEHANRTLFHTALSSLEDVERITTALHSLGLQVVKAGTDYCGQPPVTGLVFMDYYLGDPSDRTSPMVAMQTARDIYDSAAEHVDKPFIVLMSSERDVRSHAEKFRSESDLLGGLFDFASKEELTDPTWFAIRMAGWATNMPFRHKIQEFVESLDSTLRHRTDDFMSKVRSLTIEDYAFLQALSLQSDGQPLGDYIQWLFGSLLVNRVLEANDRFVSSRNEINRIRLDLQPASYLFPSNHLAELYSLAIAQPNLAEIGVHPRTPPGTGEGPLNDGLECGVPDGSAGEHPSGQCDLPLLRLGDLLVNNDTNGVYMIGTPDCDLQFAPDGSRAREETESVLLIPGQLWPLRESSVRGQMETELYLHNGEKYRIVWDRRRILTIPIGKFRAWSVRAGYSRSARIRLPYAVKLQQQVMAEGGRVGMPVAPPIQEAVSVDIYEHVGSETRRVAEALDSGVTLIHEDRDKPSFVVGRAALEALLERLHALLDKYTEAVELASGKTKERLRNNITKLQECLEDPEGLVLMLETRKKVPEPRKSTQLLEPTIGLHRGSTFSNGCRNNHIVCLNITDG